MKNIILCSLSLFIFSNLIAQNKFSLTLKDGSVINGLVRISENKIVFRKSLDSEEEFYDYKTIKKMTVPEKNYVYKIVEGSGGTNSIKLVEVVISGKISLYKGTQQIYYNPSTTNGILGGGSTSSYSIYYISNKDSDVVTNLRIGNIYSSRFKQIAKKHFKSCPDLLEKINKKYFGRYSITSVIMYFNENCGN